MSRGVFAKRWLVFRPAFADNAFGGSDYVVGNRLDVFAVKYFVDSARGWVGAERRNPYHFFEYVYEAFPFDFSVFRRSDHCFRIVGDLFVNVLGDQAVEGVGVVCVI